MGPGIVFRTRSWHASAVERVSVVPRLLCPEFPPRFRRHVCFSRVLLFHVDRISRPPRCSGPVPQTLYSSRLFALRVHQSAHSLRSPDEQVAGWTSHELIVTVAVAIVGMANALTQSSLFAIAALYPLGDCIHALNAGGGLAGLIAVLLRIASVLLVRTEPESKTASSVLVDNSSTSSALLAAMRPEIWLFLVFCACVCLVCVSILLVGTRSRTFKALITESISAALNTGQSSMHHESDLMPAFRDAREPCAAVFLSFFVTIGLFPSLFTDLPMTGSWLVISLSSASGAAETTWFVILQVLLFSSGDYAGKSIPFQSVPVKAAAPRTILVASVMRAVFFVPALYLAASGRWTPGDNVVFALALALGLSNGIVVAGGLMIAPMMAPVHRRETAGRVMFLGLISGLCSGAAAGAALKAVASKSVLSP
jgi:hypothetical protein